MYVNSSFEGNMTINERVYHRIISRLWFRRDTGGADRGKRQRISLTVVYVTYISRDSRGTEFV